MVLGGPMAHVMAAKAVALAEAAWPEFAGYSRTHRRERRDSPTGYSAAARASSPAAPRTTSCCSTWPGFGLTGRQAESTLVESGVVTNRNSIPADPNGAWYTSGVRLGTPALTTLGLGPDELDEVADIIATCCGDDGGVRRSRARLASALQARRRVADASRTRCADLLAKFPLYPTIDL